MIKARASGSKVYLYFMKKGQAGETPHSAEFLYSKTEVDQHILFRGCPPMIFSRVTAFYLLCLACSFPDNNS